MMDNFFRNHFYILYDICVLIYQSGRRSDHYCLAKSTNLLQIYMAAKDNESNGNYLTVTANNGSSPVELQYSGVETEIRLVNRRTRN